MKAILIVVMALLSQVSFASGRVVLKPVVNAETKAQTYTLALSVYEPLLAGMSYVGYMGVGERFEQSQGNWVKTEQGVEMGIGKAAVGLGVAYKYTLPMSSQFSYYGTLALTLW